MNPTKIAQLLASLRAALAAQIHAVNNTRGEVTIEVAVENLLSVAACLKEHAELRFTQLLDLAGVDYSTYGNADWQTQAASTAGFSRGVGRGQIEVHTEKFPARFAVVYHLLSLTFNYRLRMKYYLEGETLTVPSLVAIWPSADWYEREAFDLYGILFSGHPDLRRLLTDYGFIGHPFRKDFPLEGYVEVRYDPDKKRVAYQPVSIDNRVLVPRVIRDDGHWRQDESSEHESSQRDA